MAEVWFYHLETKRLEDILPPLLEKCLERQWRVVVEAGSLERRDALNQHLWSYKEESFLPHGTSEDGFEETQPIYLTCKDENPNRSNVRFLVDRAPITSISNEYERVILVFDGKDPEAVSEARVSWKELKATGYEVTYWKQNPQGRWEKVA